MIRAILARLLDRSDGADEAGGDDESDEDSRFIPSRLDDSVRAAHGGGAAEVEREVARIEAQAQVLEDYQEE